MHIHGLFTMENARSSTTEPCVPDELERSAWATKVLALRRQTRMVLGLGRARFWTARFLIWEVLAF